MKLSEALKILVEEGDRELLCRPTSLFSRLSDLVGADIGERDTLRRLYNIDRQLGLVARIMESGTDGLEQVSGEFDEQIGCTREQFDEILDIVAKALIADYAPYEPEEQEKQDDYGYVEQEPSIADCLGDKDALMQFTKAQLKQYCLEQGYRGYSKLNKEELVEFVMNGGTIGHVPTKTPSSTPSPSHNYSGDSDALPLIIGCIIVAVVIAGIVCLIVFSKQIQWYQWQHIIGSVGGLILCIIGGLLIAILGHLLDDVIMTYIDGDSMAVPIVIALFAAANIVLSFVFGSAYAIIFYWLSAYCLLASIISALFAFDEGETAACVFSIIDAVVVAVMLVTQILIRVL